MLTKVGHIFVAKQSVSWASFLSSRRSLYDSRKVVAAKVAGCFAVILT
jgi:hypothetical protein